MVIELVAPYYTLPIELNSNVQTLICVSLLAYNTFCTRCHHVQSYYALLTLLWEYKGYDRKSIEVVSH